MLGLAQVQVKPLVDFGVQISSPNLSPDGKTLAFDSCDANFTCAIYLRPIEGGVSHPLVDRDDKAAMQGDGIPPS